MFSSTSREHCQSRFYKEWHPDYIAAYNSLSDPNLKHFFNHPARKTQLRSSQLVDVEGKGVSEKEWRRQNIEWERRRREAEKDAECKHQREVDKRRARMCLRQQQREADYKQKKNKQQDLNDQVKEAWTNQEQLFSKITSSNKRDIEHLLNFLNFEIKYILRPRSAPSMTKYRGTTRKLYTDARAQTAGRRSRSNRRVASAANTTVLSNGSAYPAEAAGAAGSASVLPGHARPKSLEIENRMTSPDETVFGSGPDDVSRGGGRVTDIRNIQVPEREFSRSSHSVSPVRPKTAPTRRAVRPRSPSHPNYKEEAYLQSTVVLRYVGHTDHYTRLESRARHRAHRKSQRLPPLPAHVDEVTIEQQPRGSYVLEVFHGYLAVGDEFRFTSRRCDSYPFSLTIYVNRQCHVRLSTCCETKRTVGSRLGQGCFQLLHVQNARPCIRCVLERDPIAQKHLAKIQTMRGTYDAMGNRLPPPNPSEGAPARRSKSSSNLTQVKPLVTDYDPINDEFDLHQGDPNADQEYSLAPIDAAAAGSGSPRKSYAKAEKKPSRHRPKSAPKHRHRHPSPGEYPSNEEYYEESEEDLRVPIDDDEGSSACISDQDYHQPPPKSSDLKSAGPVSKSAELPDQNQNSPKTKQASPTSPAGGAAVSIANGASPDPSPSKSPKPQQASPSAEKAEKVN